MKKILILSVADRRHMTPSFIYEQYFMRKGLKYDIICSQKYDKHDRENPNIHCYHWKDGTSSNRFHKLIEFLKFKRFALRIINNEKYDFIVVWNENTSALFSNYLRRKYKGKYCVNIRDTVNDIGPLSFLAWACIRKAVFCTRPWIEDLEKYPQETYSLLNTDFKILKASRVHNSFNLDGRPIKITFMGLAESAIDTFKKICDVFGNDERYCVSFHGVKFNDLLLPYIEDKKYKNIYCYDVFPPEETPNILDTTDVILNYYNNGGSQLKNTIGVKASYGPFLQIPQIVDSDTYWARKCLEGCFGFPVTDISKLPDDFYQWYRNMDFNKFVKGCQDYMEFVNETNKSFYEKCDTIFK